MSNASAALLGREGEGSILCGSSFRTEPPIHPSHTSRSIGAMSPGDDSDLGFAVRTKLKFLNWDAL